MIRMATVGLAVLLPSFWASAAAGPVEEDAAATEFADWSNHPRLSAAGLEGRPTVYAFVRLENVDHLFFLEELAKLEHEFALRPVTFLVVTNESPQVVREAIDVDDVRLPIVRDAGDAAAKAFDVQVLPALVVADGRGTVRHARGPAEIAPARDALLEALRGAKPFPPPPKSLAAAARHLVKWDLGKADAELEKAAGKKLAEQDAARVADVRALIRRLTDRLVRLAEQAQADEDWPTAVVALSRLEKEHAGLPGAEQAADMLAALRADAGRATEIEAALEFARAERMARDEDWKAAQRTYESVAKRWPATQAGTRAADLAALLAQRAG